MRVTCRPSGRQSAVPAGTTLFRAVLAAGLPIASACLEEGTCGRCGLLVLSGEVSPESERERSVKADNRVPRDQRLACVARVLGDVEVRASYW